MSGLCPKCPHPAHAEVCDYEVSDYGQLDCLCNHLTPPPKGATVAECVTPQEVLSFLRWMPDQQIVNHFGEHVWLKSVPPRAGRPTGSITDCCFVEAPCDYHARLSEGDCRG